MKTFLHILICSALLLFPFAKANAQDPTGNIKVTVLDEKSQPMVGAIVMIVAGGAKTGGATDLDGNFIFSALNPGSYDIEAHMISYKKYVKTGIQVSAGQTSYATFPMQIATNDSAVVIYAEYESSPVDPRFSSTTDFSAKQLKYNASEKGNLGALVTGKSSQTNIGRGGKLVMRGAREGASQIYVDGEVLYGNSGVPSGSIEQVTVLSGGIPASYGDLTGGAVIITTKSFYDGMAQKEMMYQAAADAKLAAAQAKAAASGQRKEDATQIIEQQVPAPTTTPANDSIPAPVAPKMF